MVPLIRVGKVCRRNAALSGRSYLWQIDRHFQVDYWTVWAELNLLVVPVGDYKILPRTQSGSWFNVLGPGWVVNKGSVAEFVVLLTDILEGLSRFCRRGMDIEWNRSDNITSTGSATGLATGSASISHWFHDLVYVNCQLFSSKLVIYYTLSKMLKIKKLFCDNMYTFFKIHYIIISCT